MGVANLQHDRRNEHQALLERAARADQAARALTADASRREQLDHELAALRDELEAHLRWEDAALLAGALPGARESAEGLRAAHEALLNILDFCRGVCSQEEHALLLAGRTHDLVELIRAEICAEERFTAQSGIASPESTILSTVSRPFLPVELTTGILRFFQLGALAQDLTTEEGYRTSGVASVTLARDEHVTLVLVALRARGIMREHRAPSAATVVLLSGRARFVSGMDARQTEIGPGTLAAFSADVPHSVEAVEDATYLVIIGGRVRPPEEA